MSYVGSKVGKIFATKIATRLDIALGARILVGVTKRYLISNARLQL